jgi:hypothetical protein
MKAFNNSLCSMETDSFRIGAQEAYCEGKKFVSIEITPLMAYRKNTNERVAYVRVIQFIRGGVKGSMKLQIWNSKEEFDEAEEVFADIPKHEELGEWVVLFEGELPWFELVG